MNCGLCSKLATTLAVSFFKKSSTVCPKMKNELVYSLKMFKKKDILFFIRRKITLFQMKNSSCYLASSCHSFTDSPQSALHKADGKRLE